MRMPKLIGFTIASCLSLLATTGAAQSSNDTLPGASSYVVTAGFPISAFSSYYLKPVPTQEPQPAIHDPVLNITFPLNLTDPNTIPTNDTDPVFYPHATANLSLAAAQATVKNATLQIAAIIESSNIVGNCSKCIAALEAAKYVAQITPESVPGLLVSLCETYQFDSNATCVHTYEAGSYGAIWAQVLAFANVSGLDGHYICNSLSKTFCPAPTTSPLNVTSLFSKPKPAKFKAPAASGKRVKVLHLSDFHLDPRYSAESEANCSSSLCCRTNVANSALSLGQIALPAPLYGAYKCDTPYYLALATLQAISPLTGTDSSNSSFAWTIYTGDLVSHDSQNQLSRAYTEYAETSVYDLFKSYLGGGPVFPVLGNHDTNPEAIDGPHSLPGPLGQQFSWNYDHVSSLWQLDGWIKPSVASQARLHYGAYSTLNQYGLRIITLNSDFWYKSNYFNFINTTDPDTSGIFSFMIQELQAAEDAHERVWIIAHVLTGWDGRVFLSNATKILADANYSTNPLPNPTDLFYQIVDRYSPHVIANIFFGHTVC